MSTPYQYIDQSGVILADTSDLLTTVEGEYQTALGADLPVTADTPQGKLIVSETNARVAVVNNNAANANQLNPNLSGGVFLDAVCAFLGLERSKATFTLVPGVTLTGQPLAPLQAGIQARGTSSGAIFASASAVVLDAEGNGVSDFICVTAGPVACPVGDLIAIVSEVIGWETVNNTVAPDAAQLGQLVQSDTSLRALRALTLALQGISTSESIQSALSAVTGVNSISYRENESKVDATIDGIFLLANSVWACVDGGTDADVAAALFNNKTNGAAWNGAHVVPVTDPISKQVINVSFDRTVELPIIARVTVRQGTSTVDPTSAVPQAVADYSNGLAVDQPGFVSGAQVNPFEISNGLASLLPGLFVVKVEVALLSVGPGGYATVEIPIALNQKGSITAGSVTVIVAT